MLFTVVLVEPPPLAVLWDVLLYWEPRPPFWKDPVLLKLLPVIDRVFEFLAVIGPPKCLVEEE